MSYPSPAGDPVNILSPADRTEDIRVRFIEKFLG